MTKLIQNWQREDRYRPYKDWSQDYKDTLKKSVAQSPWRAGYHIEPKTGLLNDPNGFSYFNGKWHLFYQNYPFGPVHGLKSWYELESTDLIHWHEKGTALQPSSDYDSEGIFSGSARPINNELFIFYTGNVRTKDWQRRAYQDGAVMDKSGTIKKLDLPLIKRPDDVTGNFRDPMLFEYQHQIYMMIGTQNKDDELGRILIYKAQDNNVKHWQRISELKVPQKYLGAIVECPNLVFCGDRPVLIFCPQFLKKWVLDYQNVYPNTYLIGTKVDPETGEFKAHNSLHLVDKGFDSYATQAFNAPDGRTLAVSWLGLPEMTYPTDQYGYQGALSLVRELKVEDNELFQYPVAETLQLRHDEQKNVQSAVIDNNQYELEIEVPAEQTVSLKLFSNKAQTNYLLIEVSAETGQVIIDRSNPKHPLNPKYGKTRMTHVLEHQPIKINFFADASIFECYVNNGERLLSGRYFPDEDENHIYSDNTKFNIWKLKK